MRNLLLLAILAGCVSRAGIASRIDEDIASVARESSARTGASPARWERRPDDGAIDAEVLALLREELDDATAVRIALLNNRRVRELHEGVGIARAEWVQAGLLRNPLLAADVMIPTGEAGFELGLGRTLADLLARPLRRDLAESALEARKAEAVRELVALAFDVRRALVDLRASNLEVGLRRESLDASIAARELARRLHAAGNIPDPALTAEEAVAAAAQIDLAAAESAAAEARERLGRHLGLWGDAAAEGAWRVAGTLGEEAGLGLDPARAEERAIERSLELAAGRARIAAAAREAGLRDFEAAAPGPDSGAAGTREGDGSFAAGPRIEFPLPLLDRGHARRAISEARLRGEVARQTRLAVEIRSAARLLRDRAASLRDRARHAREVLLPLRKRLLAETLANYDAMQTGAFDLLRARREERDAERGYVETLRRAWRARLDFEELLAGSRPAALEETGADGAWSATAGSTEEH